MKLELNFIDYIGFFTIIALVLYNIIMSFVYKKRKKELLIKNGYVKEKFIPSYFEITDETLFDGVKNTIKIIKIHINEYVEFNINEELKQFKIILQAKQPILIFENQIKSFSGWTFIITFIMALFGNVPAHWDFIILLFFMYVISSQLFNLKKYVIEHFN